MAHPVYRFAEGLRDVLEARDAASAERAWHAHDLGPLGWCAMDQARRPSEGLATVLDEIDGLLLRAIDRLPRLGSQTGPDAQRILTFRLPELERLQHAAAAALVGHRYGSAGLAAVAADTTAPLARRYFAYLTLATYHRPDHWPLFARYLVPYAHHAFVGAAAEAARYYRPYGATRLLLELFEAIRPDQHLRAFLSPRILESMFVLDEPDTLDFFRELLVTGHTSPDPVTCEVTRALVMVRRFTGAVEPNTKFGDLDEAAVTRHLDTAEAVFQRQRDEFSPVAVI